jgi:hypothetical protein
MRIMNDGEAMVLACVFVVGLIALPFGAWKLIELLIWFFGHIHWI